MPTSRRTRLSEGGPRSAVTARALAATRAVEDTTAVSARGRWRTSIRAKASDRRETIV